MIGSQRNSEKATSQPSSILSVFNKRKKSFASALQSVLTNIGKDSIVKQMFNSKSAAEYLPNRITEIVERYLKDEREKCIEELYSQINSLEACFGREQIKEMEEIGNKILKEMNKDNGNSLESTYIIEELRAKASEFLCELYNSPVKKKPESQYKQIIEDLSNHLLMLRNDLQKMNKDQKHEIQETKNRLFEKFNYTISNLEISEYTYKSELSTREAHKAFRQESKRLQEQYDSELSEHLEKHQQLEKELQKARNRNKRIGQKYTALLDENESLKARNKHLEEISQKLEKTEIQNSSLEAQIESMGREIKARDKQIKAIMDQHAAAPAMDEALESALTKARAEYDRKDKQVGNLKAALESLRKEYEVILSKLKMAHAESELNQTKLNRAKQIEKEYEHLQKRNKEFEETESELRLTINSLQSELALEKKEKESMEEEIKSNETLNRSELESKIKELGEELNEMKILVEEKENELNNLRITNSNLTQKYMAADESARNSELTIERLKTELSEIEIKHKETISKLEESYSEPNLELSANSKSYEALVCDLKKKVLNGERQKTMTLRELDDKNTEISKLSSLLGNAIEDKKALASANKELSEQLRDTTSELSNKETIIRNFIEADKATKTQINSIQDELEETQNKLRDQTKLTHKAEKRILLLRNVVENKDEEIQRLKEAAESSADNATKARNSLSDAEHHNESLIIQNKELLQIINETKARMHEMRNTIAQYKNESLMYKEKYEKSLESSSMNISATKSETEKIQSEKKRIEAELKKALEEARQSVKEKNVINVKLEETMLELQSVQKDVKRKAEEAQFAKERAEREISKRDEIINFEREKSEKEQERFKELLIKAHQSAEIEAKNMTEQTEKEREALQSRTEAAEQRVQALQQKLKDIKMDLQSQIDNLTIKKGKLSQIGKQLASDLEKAEEENTQMKKDKKNLESSIEAIIGDGNLDNLPVSLSEMKKRHDRNIADINEIRRLYMIGKDEDLITELRNNRKRFEELDTRNESLKMLFPETDESNLSKIIGEIKSRDDIIKNIFDSELDPKSIPQLIKGMKKRQDTLMSLFGVEDPVDLQDEISEMLGREKQLLELVGTNKKDLVSTFSDMKKREDILKEAFEVEDPKDLPRTIQEMKRREDIIKESFPDISIDKIPRMIQEMKIREDSMLQAIGEGDDVKSLPYLFSSMKQREDDIKKIFGDVDVNVLPRLIDAMKQREDEIAAVFGVSPENIRQLPKAVVECKRREEEIAEAFGVPANQLVKAVLKTKERETKISELLGKDPNSLTQAIEDMKSAVDAVGSVFEIRDIKSIPEAMDRLQKDLTFITFQRNKMLELAGAHDVDDYEKVIALKNSAYDTIKNICELFEVPNASMDEIYALVESSKNNSDRLLKLESEVGRLPGNGTAEEKLKKYVKAHQGLERMCLEVSHVVENEYGSDISSAVSQMRRDLGSAADLFTRLFAVLAGDDQPTVTFAFPLQDSFVENLLQIIAQFKLKVDETTKQTMSILAEARNEGYTGSKLTEAVTQITKSKIEKARDEQMGLFHVELSTLQTNLEGIQCTAEREKERLKKRNIELTNAIESEKKRLLERERELLGKIDEADAKVREAQGVAESHKKIRDELLRFISGEGTDMEFLSSHLSPAETKILKSRKCM